MEGLLALARGVLLPKPLALPALSASTAEYLCVITAQVSYSWYPFLLLEPSGGHSLSHTDTMLPGRISGSTPLCTATAKRFATSVAPCPHSGCPRARDNGLE
jgi:hypothetical protein